MTYEDMCKFIFWNEGFTNWEQVKNVKSSKKNFIRARYLCMYFGPMFFKHMALDNFSDIFGMAHGAVPYANKTIVNDCLTDPGLKRKINDYYTDIKRLQNISHGYDEFRADYREQRINDVQQDILSKIKVIADIYCEITGKKIS